MLSSVDTKTMIHVGVEMVVIGGITFWLNKRISGVQDIVDDLVKKIKSLESIIQQQEQMISRHENILRQIMGGHAPPISRSQTSPQASPQTSPQNSSPYQNPSPPSQDQELSPDDLDALLEEQLSIINDDREKKGTLKPRRTRKKGRRKHKSHGD